MVNSQLLLDTRLRWWKKFVTCPFEWENKNSECTRPTLIIVFLWFQIKATRFSSRTQGLPISLSCCLTWHVNNWSLAPGKLISKIILSSSAFYSPFSPVCCPAEGLACARAVGCKPTPARCTTLTRDVRLSMLEYLSLNWAQIPRLELEFEKKILLQKGGIELQWNKLCASRVATM